MRKYPHGNFPEGEDMRSFNARVRQEIEFLIGESKPEPIAVMSMAESFAQCLLRSPEYHRMKHGSARKDTR